MTKIIEEIECNDEQSLLCSALLYSAVIYSTLFYSTLVIFTLTALLSILIRSVLLFLFASRLYIFLLLPLLELRSLVMFSRISVKLPTAFNISVFFKVVCDQVTVTIRVKSKLSTGEKSRGEYER
jgi:hypothetical protein